MGFGITDQVNLSWEFSSNTMKHMLKHHVNTNPLPFYSSIIFIELLLK
jgi:hypothetical protein